MYPKKLPLIERETVPSKKKKRSIWMLDVRVVVDPGKKEKGMKGLGGSRP